MSGRKGNGGEKNTDKICEHHLTAVTNRFNILFNLKVSGNLEWEENSQNHFDPKGFYILLSLLRLSLNDGK